MSCEAVACKRLTRRRPDDPHTAGDHVKREGAVLSLVLKAVAGVGAGQAAQHQQPRHETEIGVRFAGRNKQVHLIGLGEVVACLGRKLEGFVLRPRRAGEDFPDGNHPHVGKWVDYET